MSRPRISIVTATRNCAEPLVITRSSLQIQAFQDFEWVLQDCLSTDETRAVAEASGLNMSLVSMPDKGIYDALNKAVRRCQGDWVLFLGAGDWLAGSQALAVLSRQLTDALDIAICNVFEISTSGQIFRRVPDHPAAKLELLRDLGNHQNYPFFLERIPCHQGIVMRRSLLEQVPFDCAFRVSADWNQLMHLTARGCRIGMIDHVLSWYPNGGFSAENSHLWIQDVRTIAAYFSGNPQLAEQYFGDCHNEHFGNYQTRVALKQIIDASLVVASA
jgi:glycosyltransferase involved in cell wall biosynthesis